MEHKELTQSQAVNILIQGARIAQSKGAFSLEDAELVSRAIKVFIPSPTNADGVDPALNSEDKPASQESDLSKANV
jgi:hypothetical protein